MSYSHVAHDCQVGNQCVLANSATLGGHVELGDWVIMGGFAAIHQFCKVGAHAFLANNAAVTRDVPPYVMAVGGPARPHSINSEGLKRRGFSAEQIRNLRNAYRVLYRSGLQLEEASSSCARRPRRSPKCSRWSTSSRSPPAAWCGEQHDLRTLSRASGRGPVARPQGRVRASRSWPARPPATTSAAPCWTHCTRASPACARSAWPAHAWSRPVANPGSMPTNSP